MYFNYRKTDRIIRLPEVTHLTGEGRSTIYAKMTVGRFPRQRKLGGGRSVGWSLCEIRQHIRITLAGSEYIARAMRARCGCGWKSVALVQILR